MPHVWELITLESTLSLRSVSQTYLRKACNSGGNVKDYGEMSILISYITFCNPF